MNYEIKTIKELLDVVTPENMECFLKDFSSWLAMNVMVNSVNKKLGKIASVKTSGSFNWIDDGKNDINIKVEIKNN